jgi:hypothetical protein
MAFIASVAAVVLMMAPAVFAKGPTGATIEGEGVAGTIDIDEPGELGQGTSMSELVEEAGFFPLVFEEGSGLSEPPTPFLGRPLLITWRMGNDVVVEELYLHASGGPVAHVAPGQFFWDATHASGGGWLRISNDIAAPLIALGVPEPVVAHLRPDGLANAAPAPGDRTPAAAREVITPRPIADRTADTSSEAAPSPATASRSVAVSLLTAAALGGAIGVAAWRIRSSPRTH